jgi:hypothetical protein
LEIRQVLQNVTTGGATVNISASNITTTFNSPAETGNILLSGSLASLANPQIHSELKTLYMYLFYDDTRWLHLKGAIQSNTNYTDFEAKVVLYNNAHQISDVDDGFWKVISIGNIKAFEALIASPDKLKGVTTYQIDGELT